jgi:hypothetical protein
MATKAWFGSIPLEAPLAPPPFDPAPNAMARVRARVRVRVRCDGSIPIPFPIPIPISMRCLNLRWPVPVPDASPLWCARPRAQDGVEVSKKLRRSPAAMGDTYPSARPSTPATLSHHLLAQ